MGKVKQLSVENFIRFRLQGAKKKNEGNWSRIGPSGDGKFSKREKHL
jgi:hypothetical protein